ncbi:hypothetical protein CFP56_043649 [Quercus suber]|uniref:Uncharacterized protein n=1 Tax=Quercus suber TaxID=58331 RepID=A0AAW0LHR0_QUESU
MRPRGALHSFKVTQHTQLMYLGRRWKQMGLGRRRPR